MSSVQDHPDIENLPLEIDGIPVRETIREIFRNLDNGTPDNISKAGCLALALKSNELGGKEKGYVVWNAWREFFPFKWDGLKNFVKFDGATFQSQFNLSKFKFGDFANFQGSIWEGLCTFEGAEWGTNSQFQGALWGIYAKFKGAKWGARANFSGAQWGDGADFEGTQWGANANFSASSVELVNLHHRENLNHAKGICLQVGLNPARFRSCSFKRAIFIGEVNFSYRSFEGAANFESAAFCGPPKFHGCEFHQDTSFDGAAFLPATGNKEAARAYRTLKLAFSKQQAIREEQRFFRLEMEEETLRETGLKRWLFWAYKEFSDYGFSVTRPLRYWGLGVLALTAFYGLLSWLGQCGGSVQACRFAPQWLEFLLLQTLPLPGLDKLSETASKAFWPVGAWWGLALSALVIVHKTISLAALFLIGLALRNLFKLK